MGEKIVFRSGVELYPRLFHSLRASLETEYHRAGINPTTYCRWLGNSPRIAMEHYIRYTDEDLQAGIDQFCNSAYLFKNLPHEFPHESPLNSPLQDGAENCNGEKNDLNFESQVYIDNGDMHRSALSCNAMRKRRILVNIGDGGN